MQVICKHFNELSAKELYSIFALRCEVFMIEQHCDETEFDGKDFSCYHLCFYDAGVLAGYARLLPPGVSYKEMSIGRIVVHSNYRRKGFGKNLLKKAIEKCYEYFGKAPIKISAQLYLQKFYESFGFVRISNVYDEAGIAHIKMMKEG
jgi:ElaA protein